MDRTAQLAQLGSNADNLLAMAQGYGSITGRRINLNGDMLIDQRNQGASVTFATTDQKYIVDKLRLSTGALTTQVVSAQQVTSSFSQFQKSLKVTIGGTGAALAAGGYCALILPFEGYDIANLNWGYASAVPITISFHAKPSVTGTYALSIRNGPSANRSYVASFALTANVDNFVYLTIPPDTTGTYGSTNTAGMYLSFDLGVGTTYSTTAGSWQNGTFFGLTGGTKLATYTGATFEISGIQVERGNTYTTFEYRSYSYELEALYRYCYVWRSTGNYDPVCTARIASDGKAYGFLPFPRPLRATPTFTLTAGSFGFFQWLADGTSNYNGGLAMLNSGYGYGEYTNGALLQSNTSLSNGMMGFIGAYNIVGATMVFDADM